MPTATLILNPWSGGGKYQPVVRAAAERCGWVIREVGPGADPAVLAASSDTDVLVVAGGDGTVSAVAAVAVERDMPLVVCRAAPSTISPRMQDWTATIH